MVGGAGALSQVSGGYASSMSGAVEHEPDGVEITVVPRSPTTGLGDRMRAALRAEGLIGVVYPFSDDFALHGWIVVDDRSLALRATGEGVESGLELTTVAARLSRSLDAAVLLDTCTLPVRPHGTDEDGELRIVPDGIDLDASWDTREASMSRTSDEEVRAVAVVPLPASVVATRFPEAALGTRARTVLVPDGDRTIVVTDGLRSISWWRAACPIVRLVEVPDWTDIEVLVHSRWLGADRAWAHGWVDPPVGIQSQEHAAAVELQLGFMQRVPYLEPSPELADRLGWGAGTLDVLRSMGNEPRPTLHALAVAIEGSPTLLRIAGGADPEDEPGAVVYPPTTARAILVEAMRTPEPDPDTAWSRSARWWRGRPGLSIAIGILMLAISAAVAMLATVADGWTWWRVVLCIVVLVNGIGILGAAARARRARRSAE